MPENEKIGEGKNAAICQNCGHIFAEESLFEVTNLLERISPGEPFPSGECPECGAFCLPYRGKEGECPRCFSELDYSDNEADHETVSYRVECRGCGWLGLEVHDTYFREYIDR